MWGVELKVREMLTRRMTQNPMHKGTIPEDLLMLTGSQDYAPQGFASRAYSCCMLQLFASGGGRMCRGKCGQGFWLIIGQF